MEQLLHYTWKHRLFPLGQLFTTDGQPVEIVDVGLHNHDAGPDFFNAKVKIDGQLFVGNVELHLRSSDWYLHRHEQDAAYDNVILHVVEQANQEVQTHAGRTLPQLEIHVPSTIRQRYAELLRTDHYPPCYAAIPNLSRLTVHAWMSALQTERLERKTQDIQRRVEQCNGDWEQAWFVSLARYFGFGVNNDAMEQWALSIPLQQLAHVGDDLFQIEAFFYGQAGLLQTEAVPQRYRSAVEHDEYFLRLQREYQYQQVKYHLQPIDHHLWRFLRLRPQNFPHVRLSQLASLAHQQHTRLAQMVSATTLKQLRELFRAETTEYFHTHYLFGHASPRSPKTLSVASVDLLLVNTAIPMLFAYGRHRSDETLCERAFQLLDSLRAEDNHIVRMWRECGLEVQTAGDSQALIQLKREYCDRRDCLRCRFAFEFLRNSAPHPSPLTEAGDN